MFERIIYENMEKGYQLRLVLNEFREVEYLHLRKYFLSYEGEWCASKEGASMIATLSNTYALLDALIELCSQAESVDSITSYFEDKISHLKQRV